MKINFKRSLSGLAVLIVALSLQSCYLGVSSAPAVFQQRALFNRPAGLIATSSAFWLYDPFRRSYFDTRCNRYFNQNRNVYYSAAPRRFNNAFYPHSWRPNRGIAFPAPRFNNRRNFQQRTVQPSLRRNQFQRNGINNLRNVNQNQNRNRNVQAQRNNREFREFSNQAQRGNRVQRQSSDQVTSNRVNRNSNRLNRSNRNRSASHSRNRTMQVARGVMRSRLSR